MKLPRVKGFLVKLPRRVLSVVVRVELRFWKRAAVGGVTVAHMGRKPARKNNGPAGRDLRLRGRRTLSTMLVNRRNQIGRCLSFVHTRSHFF